MVELKKTWYYLVVEIIEEVGGKSHCVKNHVLSWIYEMLLCLLPHGIVKINDAILNWSNSPKDCLTTIAKKFE